MKTIGNILIIALLFLGVYTFRDTIRPISQKVSESVGSFIDTVKEHPSLSMLPDAISTPIQSINVPGPLEVPKPKNETPASSTTSSTSTAQTSGGQAITRANIIYWTNQARAANNLPPLSENSVLDVTASAKTDDMFAKSYFEHTSPTGMTVSSQAKNAGYSYLMIGENLALGQFASAKEIVDAWMASPGHRANILNTRYSEIGIGVKKSTYQGNVVWIATQHFGLPSSACPSVDANLKNIISENQARLTQLETALKSKKQEIDNTSQLSSDYNTKIAEYNVLVKEYNALAQTVKDQVSTYNTEVQVYNLCVQG
jgi:uncharacterized protein YkwD